MKLKVADTSGSGSLPGTRHSLDMDWCSFSRWRRLCHRVQ